MKLADPESENLGVNPIYKFRMFLVGLCDSPASICNTIQSKYLVRSLECVQPAATYTKFPAI